MIHKQFIFGKYVHLLKKYCVCVEGETSDIEQVPIEEYFIPNTFIPVIFKFKNYRENHLCFQIVNDQGELNGWSSRKTLDNRLIYKLPTHTSFYITSDDKSLISKIKLSL